MREARFPPPSRGSPRGRFKSAGKSILYPKRSDTRVCEGEATDDADGAVEIAEVTLPPVQAEATAVMNRRTAAAPL